MVLAAAAACEDKKGEDTRVLELDPADSGFTDFFLITSGTNERQTQAIADEVELKLKRDFGVYPNSVEGRRQGEWVLLDYVDFVVHVFLAERRAYYDILERTQKGVVQGANGMLDVTPWLAWFLDNLRRALEAAQHTLDAVLAKSRFWQRFNAAALNERQVTLLNRLLDGFDGKLTSSKWASIAKCSPDTALRDINELIALGALRRSEGGGRSTAYELDA